MSLASLEAVADPLTFNLQIPAAKVLTPREELALYRAAYQRSPENESVRGMLAGLLVEQDEFDEAIALLQLWRVPRFSFALLEADALLSRETREADLACEALYRQAADWSTTETERSLALAGLGKILVRLGRPAEARASLEEALALNAAEKDAYKRTAALDLKEQRPDDVLSRAARLLDNGVVHSRLIASQSLALASMGRVEEARASQGLDEFLVQFDPAPPEGWSSLQAFTQDLATELIDHPGTRYGRYGVASSQSWRIDEPGLKRMRVFPTLQNLIRREVQRYVAQLPAGTHPFLQGRPRVADLRNWCVIAEGSGHEEWHVHQGGWLSGTFYIQVPEHIAQGTGKGGCIAFGLPGETVGQENADRFGEVLCRPHAGLMTIFPSHTFHRTYPHGGAGRRICYAFDIIPRSAED